MSATTPTVTGREVADLARTYRGSFLGDSVVVARRNLRRIARQPQIAVFVLIQPIMFVLLFRYIFGGAINVPGIPYVDFLMPGIIVQTLVFGAATTAIGVAEDLKSGIVDRFRALPMNRSAAMAGRVVSDQVLNLVSLVVMVVVGLAVGWRPSGTPAELALAFLVVEFFALSFSWIMAAIGLALKEPEAVQSAGFVWLFPLTFISNVFVPPSTMPAILQNFAENINPVSLVANSARVLTSGVYLCGQDLCTDVSANVLGSIAWSVGIMVVFVPLSAWLWGRLGD